MIIQNPPVSAEDKIKLEEYEMKLKELEIKYDKLKKEKKLNDDFMMKLYRNRSRLKFVYIRYKTRLNI